MHDFVMRIEYCQSYYNEPKEIVYPELTCGFCNWHDCDRATPNDDDIMPCVEK